MITTEKRNCSGCSACMAVCPRACISMQEDEEGFDYPSVNAALCVNCDLCQSVCPIGREIEQKIETTGIAVQNNDETIREISSAGGAIGAILSMVFEKNGVAFCVGMNDDNIPMFYEVHSMRECRERRVLSSKYVSSIIGNTYQAVKENLDRGGGGKQLVCFIGLPCQSAGLKSFLRKPYDNLLLIDLVCYGVPSRKLYRKYLAYLTEKYHSGIVDVRFRDKTFGYAAPSMCIELEDGRIKSQNNDVKSFLRTFFSHISMRPSCHNCAFKGLKRNTDLTVGDIKNIGVSHPEMDDDRGTTLVYVHSEKGRTVLEALRGSIKCGEVPIGNALNAKSEKVTQSAAAHPMRAAFFREIDTLPYPELIDKYCPAPPKDVIASIVKQFLLILGLNKTGIMKIIKKHF